MGFVSKSGTPITNYIVYIYILVAYTYIINLSLSFTFLFLFASRGDQFLAALSPVDQVVTLLVSSPSWSRRIAGREPWQPWNRGTHF